MPGERPRIFFDSNSLLYLISADADKAQKVMHHLYEGGGFISVQVLNEFVNVARRKHFLSAGEIGPVLLDIRQTVEVIPVTISIHEIGLRMIERYRFATYDAMIVAAALDSGCATLLSEAMQHGMVVDGSLEIRNPFR
jgi:predicted nucleic acid-binding protein